MITTNVQLPASFERCDVDFWRSGNLSISLNEGWCEHSYREIATAYLYQNYMIDGLPDSREFVVGYGYSIAEAVAALNRMLKRMGIAEYPVDGLPTEHDTHFEYHYLRAWVARHFCEGEDLEKKRKFAEKFRYSFVITPAVVKDLNELYATQLSEPWEAPAEETFPIGRSRSGSPTLRVTGEYDDLEPEDLILAYVGTFSSSLARLIYTDYDWEGRKFHLAVVNPGDIVITGRSVQYAHRVLSDKLMIPVYRVNAVLEDTIVCMLTEVPVTALPSELSGIPIHVARTAI